MEDFLSNTTGLFIFMFFVSIAACCFMNVFYYLLEK